MNGLLCRPFSRSNSKWYLSGLTATALLLVSSPLQAATIQAEATWELDGVPGALSPDIDGPATTGFVDVLAGDNDTNNNSIFYHTFGNVSGNFGSRVSGNGTYNVDGLFTFEETFVNPSSSPSPASFTFTIVPGELSTFISPSYTPTAGEMLFAGYEIDIRVNGTSIWDSSAEVEYDGATNMTTFTDTGSNSIGGTFTPSGNGGSYTWPTFTQTIPIGTLPAGGSFLLEYDLKTTATGNLPTNCTAMDMGGEPGQGERPPFPIDPDNPDNLPCGGSIARSGDPLMPDFEDPTPNSLEVDGAVPQRSVPEPSNLLSLLILPAVFGLASLKNSDNS